MKWLAELPSTNARIFATILCMAATTVRYLALGVPAGGDAAWYTWLAFLIAMAGIDFAQFRKKRDTYEPPSPKPGDPPAPPDREDAPAATPSTLADEEPTPTTILPRGTDASSRTGE